MEKIERIKVSDEFLRILLFNTINQYHSDSNASFTDSPQEEDCL